MKTENIYECISSHTRVNGFELKFTHMIEKFISFIYAGNEVNTMKLLNWRNWMNWIKIVNHEKNSRFDFEVSNFLVKALFKVKNSHFIINWFNSGYDSFFVASSSFDSYMSVYTIYLLWIYSKFLCIKWDAYFIN